LLLPPVLASVPFILQVGASSAASAPSVAIKNLSDIAVSSFGFWTVGYALAYGVNGEGTSNPFVGEGQFLLLGAPDLGLFLFRYAFAATASTIVSGSIVGRILFKHYIILALLMSTVIYPIAAHAAWSPQGFMNSLGFLDYAGSCVVHVTGGMVGLCASVWLGPRRNVFRPDGEYAPTRASPTQAVLGAVCLWYGWFSFNAGSSQRVSQGGMTMASRSAAATLIASGAGFLVALAWSWIRTKGKQIHVFDSATGLLAGLVSISACCASVRPWEACLIGAIGSTAAMATSKLIVHLRIDDPVAVIPVHLAGGATGTLLAGLFANDPAVMLAETGAKAPQRTAGLFHGGGAQLLGVQALGLLFVMVWAGVGFLMVAAVISACFGGLRTPAADSGEDVHSDEAEARRRRSMSAKSFRVMPRSGSDVSQAINGPSATATVSGRETRRSLVRRQSVSGGVS